MRASGRRAARPAPGAACAVLLTLLLGTLAAPAIHAADGAPGPLAADPLAADRSWASVPARTLLGGTHALRLRDEDRAALRTLPGSARVGIHPATGRVRFLGGPRRLPLARPMDLRRAARRAGAAAPGPDDLARAFLARTGHLFGLARPADLLTLRVHRTPDGRSVVRYQQRRGRLPVIGGELLVTLDRRGAPLSVAGELLPAADRVDRAPFVSMATARSTAAAWVAREADVRAGAATTRSEGLAIHDPRLLGGEPGGPRLVWRIDARAEAPVDGLPVHHLVLVDARDGTVRAAPSRVAHGLERQICDFESQRRADFRCTPALVTRDEGDPPTGLAQVDVMYARMADVYDFYRDWFGRDSLDGQGQRMVATVRYCSLTWCPMQNAFWEWGPAQATFGNGWASVDDLVGHEFTHGVLDHEARLFYDHQSGALNESFADIFGEIIDLTNGIGDDWPVVRWRIGEDLPIGTVRDLAHPGRFGDPDRVRSPQWWSGPGDFGGVHTNSTVGGKAATLIADGGTFNGRRIAGIGLVRMARIEYEAMTNRLTSAADYLDLHDALLQACVELVGTDGISLGHCRSVRDAVDATEMDLLPREAAPRTAPLCATGRYPVTSFLDDLERPGLDQWASRVLAGISDPWHYPPNPNDDPTWDGTWASSGVLNLFGDDLPRVTDAVMTLRRGMLVPPGGRLRFEHGYRFDIGSRPWDGGVVEVSVDGGPWRDLGSRFISAGYTGRLAAGRGNPLGGRRAFTGRSWGWGASRVDLSDWAGRRIRVRFRIGTDRSVGAVGWYIDDVQIYRCALDGSPPTGSVRIGGGAPITRSALQTLRIEGEDATSGVSRLRVSNRGTLRGGLLRDGLEMPFTRSLEWRLTDTAWDGSTADGPRRVFVQLRDRAGNWSDPFRDRVLLDTTPPSVGVPRLRFLAGTSVWLDPPRVAVRVALDASDATSGLAATSLERQRDGGDWDPVHLGGPTGTRARMRLPADPDPVFAFRARATDRAGNASDWQATPPLGVIPTQDASDAWELSGDWTVDPAGSAWGGSVLASADDGARATLAAAGRSVALVAPRGPDLGIARILVDGASVGTVDLYAPQAQPRVVVWAGRLASGSHTIGVEVTGGRHPGSSGRRVAIDAVVALP